VLNISNKGLELLYSLSSAISNFKIAPSIIYMSFIKENTKVTDPYSILIGCNCLYPIIENVKKG
jgi:formylmethanofuran dehydrogenase subunit A